MYWFCSRTLRTLEEAYRLPLHPVWTEILNDLQVALRGEATQQVLGEVQAAMNASSGMFWYDFLGANDSTPSYNDAVYTTAVALNFLLRTWTFVNESAPTKPLQWRDDTPCDVISVTSSGRKFLDNNVLAEHVPDPWFMLSQLQGVESEADLRHKAVTADNDEAHLLANSFFSGSVKGLPSLWFLFPANVYHYLNGTAFPSNPSPEDITPHTLVAMKGVIPPEEYDDKVKNPVFGYTPTTFGGFNAKDAVFPYWTSYSVTRSFALMSLLQLEDLEPSTMC